MCEYNIGIHKVNIPAIRTHSLVDRIQMIHRSVLENRKKILARGDRGTDVKRLADALGVGVASAAGCDVTMTRAAEMMHDDGDEI